MKVRVFRETHSPTSYLTVARFASEQAWRQFRADNDAAYTALGERLDHLTLAQEELV